MFILIFFQLITTDKITYEKKTNYERHDVETDYELPLVWQIINHNFHETS